MCLFEFKPFQWTTGCLTAELFHGTDLAPMWQLTVNSLHEDKCPYLLTWQWLCHWAVYEEIELLITRNTFVAGYRVGYICMYWTFHGCDSTLRVSFFCIGQVCHKDLASKHQLSHRRHMPRHSQRSVVMIYVLHSEKRKHVVFLHSFWKN